MTAPLHIAFVHPAYRPDGGAERILARMLAALGEHAVCLTVVTRRWDGAGADPNITVVRCDPFSIGRLWREISFARAACRALTPLEADLIQSQTRIPCCHLYRAGGGVHRVWLRERNRARGWRGTLGQSLSLYHRHKLAEEARLYASPKLRAVICNSRMVAEEIREEYGIDPARLRVIYNGVDSDHFRPGMLRAESLQIRARLGIAPETPVFLFVGSGFERKNLAGAIRALAQMSRSDARLIAVGQDRQASRYRALARRLGVGSRVHLVGRQTDVRPWYGAADALVLPTLYDPFANVVLEAMASGLPVVTSLKCGAVDLIEIGRNGLLCDALDDTALAAHMERLCDPRVRERIGDAGRETVLPLSLDRMAGELMALYRELLSIDAP
ncbi:MAG TPA: glycosyltransferase family 4 protein [Candidatus Macondimonas sp.]|nr:glycosyltransferase family 4 protein [Candidatus Macondimonas sp.]